jgi:hypothetical protein
LGSSNQPTDLAEPLGEYLLVSFISKTRRDGLLEAERTADRPAVDIESLEDGYRRHFLVFRGYPE